MPRTLEDLLKDLIAIEKTESEKPNYQIATNPVKPWSCNVFRSNASSEAPRAKDLPPELIQEMQMPLSVEGIFHHLKKFHSENRHKPFVQMKMGPYVLYIENDESQSLIRVYLGNKSNLKTRGNGRAVAFTVEEVYEYQELMISCENGEKVRLRNRKPVDFLSSPDRAQGKAIVPEICFSVFPEKDGVSSFSVKPEYVRAESVQMKIRRQA